MTTADVLREARKLVERGWTQGFFARDADGRPCDPETAEAVCWCVVGALDAVTADSQPAYEAIQQALGLGANTVHSWNDARGRTQAEVLAAFSRAIELADAQEGVK